MSWEEAVAGKHYLENRFDTFNDMINTPNIYWNILKNTISGDDDTWCYLMKVSFKIPITNYNYEANAGI